MILGEPTKKVNHVSELIGNGLLHDWDLPQNVSRLGDLKPKLAERGDGARACERTGTWPFMSIAVLRDTTKIHAIRDDLESFFWVSLYYALLYVPHTHSAALPEMIKTVFHYHDFAGTGGTIQGGGTKVNLIQGAYIGPVTMFSFTHCPPLLPFLYSTILRISGWYSDDQVHTQTWVLEHLGERIPPFVAAPLGKAHEDIEDIWKKALEANDWPSDDKAICQLPEKAATGSRSSVKRPPHDESLDEQTEPANLGLRINKKVKTSHSARH